VLESQHVLYKVVSWCLKVAFEKVDCITICFWHNL